MSYRMRAAVLRAIVGMGVLMIGGCAGGGSTDSGVGVRGAGGFGGVGEVSVDVSRDELEDHVAYLTSETQGGRSAGSAGSRRARRYIERQMRAAGLIGWGKGGAFEVEAGESGQGVNVVGVVRGTDPAVTDEFVLVTAHYDHLGFEKVDRGGLSAFTDVVVINRGFYPGAADNAAGVTVMLEVAERLGRGQRPRRSVVFAALDLEEKGLLGAHSLAAMAGFDETKLAGVVNLDMLGRKVFDVIDRGVIAAGTERFAGLRGAVDRAGEAAGLRVLKVGRELVGPRSDHVVFEVTGKPWVFFTCGPYVDYHEMTDRVDRLDFDLLVNTAGVVGDSVAWLRDAAVVEEGAVVSGAVEEELSVVAEAVEGVLGSAAWERELQRGDRVRLAGLAAWAGALHKRGGVSEGEALAIRQELVDAALPVVMGRAVTGEERYRVLLMHDYYVHYPAFYVEMWGEMWAYVSGVESVDGGIGPSEHELKRRLYAPVDGQGVRMERLANRAGGVGGVERLSVLLPYADMDLKRGWFNSWAGGVETGSVIGFVEGGRGELIDYCLAKWESYPEGWRRIAAGLAGVDQGNSLEAWEAWRAAQAGFGGDVAGWRWSLVSSGNVWLARAVLVSDRGAELMRDREVELAELLRDDRVDDVLRGVIISAVREIGRGVLVGAMVDVIHDESIIDVGVGALLRRMAENGYAFAGRQSFGAMLSVRSAVTGRVGSAGGADGGGEVGGGARAIGQLAAARLSELSGREYGSDVGRWRQWEAGVAGDGRVIVGAEGADDARYGR